MERSKIRWDDGVGDFKTEDNEIAESVGSIRRADMNIYPFYGGGQPLMAQQVSSFQSGYQTGLSQKPEQYIYIDGQRVRKVRLGWRTKLSTRLPFIKRSRLRFVEGTCSMCVQRLVEPRFMRTCPHGFCESCLRAYVDKKRLIIGERLPCPVCNIPCPNPLPITNLPRFQQIICSLNPYHGPASVTCEECQKSVCDECAPIFREMHSSKVFESHQLEATRQAECHVVHPYSKRLMYCKRHQDILCRKWCNNCSVAICINCVNDIHKEHEYVDLKALAEKRIAELEYLLSLVIQKIKENKKADKDIVKSSSKSGGTLSPIKKTSRESTSSRKLRDRIKEYCEGEKKILKRAYQDAVRAIRDQEKNMKRELEESDKKYISARTAYKKAVKQAKKVAKRLSEHINYLINKADYHEITHDAVYQVRKEVEMITTIPAPPKEKDIRIVSTGVALKVEFMVNKVRAFIKKSDGDQESSDSEGDILNHPISRPLGLLKRSPRPSRESLEREPSDTRNKFRKTKKNTSKSDFQESLSIDSCKVQPKPKGKIEGSLEELDELKKEQLSLESKSSKKSKKSKVRKQERARFAEKHNDPEQVVEIYVTDVSNRLKTRGEKEEVDKTGMLKTVASQTMTQIAETVERKAKKKEKKAEKKNERKKKKKTKIKRMGSDEIDKLIEKSESEDDTDENLEDEADENERRDEDKLNTKKLSTLRGNASGNSNAIHSGIQLFTARITASPIPENFANESLINESALFLNQAKIRKSEISKEDRSDTTLSSFQSTSHLSKEGNQITDYSVISKLTLDENYVIRDICLTKNCLILGLECIWEVDSGQLISLPKNSLGEGYAMESKKILFNGAIRCCSATYDGQEIYFAAETSQKASCRLYCLKSNQGIQIVEIFDDVKALHLNPSSFNHGTVIAKLKGDKFYTISHWTQNFKKLVWKEMLSKSIDTDNRLFIRHDHKLNTIAITDCSNLWIVERNDTSCVYNLTKGPPSPLGICLYKTGFLIAYHNGLAFFDDDGKRRQDLINQLPYSCIAAYDELVDKLYIGTLNGHLYILEVISKNKEEANE
ncbi:unnamed protein product [Dimorphilus gyrociliatus]|uniref:Uncharacterized protein n=1 Tax=Dimorphilus gyrociliatus TaxID=2664684 RepID=A0A7I8VZH7_9ANNE|nr:unnamed protein product [Dimorphilus gyrociliatus]